MYFKVVSILFLILLVFPLTFAAVDYNETGNYDSYYQQGTGFFNDVQMQSSADYAMFTRAVTGTKHPLVSDLDGDGVNEIIVLDDDTLRLYHVDVVDEQLDIVDAFAIAGDYYSNILVYDIDGDSRREIIVASEAATNELIYILEYNGTTFGNQTNVNYSSLGHDNGEILIKCRDTEMCMMAYIHDQTVGVNANATVSIATFNSSSVSNEDNMLAGTASQQRCFPSVRSMAVADYDNDGNDEYIFSFPNYRHTAADAGEVYYIAYVEQASNGFLTTDLIITIDDSVTNIDEVLTGGSGTICYNQLNFDDGTSDQTTVGSIMTNPLVFDADGSSSNGLETIVGIMLDPDEFIMLSFESDGDKLDDYPEVFEADGKILSNVIRANVFPDSGDNDFCVMGYDNHDEEIDLLCASEQTTDIPETREFKLSVEGMYNITRTHDKYSNLVHAAQHSTDTTDGANLHEMICSYGVLQINWDDTYAIQLGANILSLDLIFENPQTDAAVISIDAAKAVVSGGREDLIVLTSTNVWYIDDKFVNSPAYISEYYNNPCLDSTWRINTSIETRITPVDDDGDRVGARAILYYGDSNEQDSGWSANVSSGSTITFSTFELNKTIGVGTLRLMARDVENPDTHDIIDLSFSVGLNGVEFGDCTTEVELDTEEEEDEEDELEAILSTDATDNFVINTLEEVQDLTGVGGTLFWYIMMILVAISIWFTPQAASHPYTAFGFMIGVEALLLITGTITGVVPIGFLIAVIIICIVIFGLWIGKAATGAHSNG